MEPPITGAETTTRWLPLSLIDIPDYARIPDPAKLESLAAVMAKEEQLQEIIVMKAGDRFEVLAGARRLRAAQKLGWDKIRCLVKEPLSEFDRYKTTFSENENREQAQAMYQATLIKRMKVAGNLGQEELAKELGLSRGHLSQFLIVADLDGKTQEFATRVANLTLRHLLELARLPHPEDQLACAVEASQKDLSVKALKLLVDARLSPTQGPVKPVSGADTPQGPQIHFHKEGVDLVIQAKVPWDLGIDWTMSKVQTALRIWGPTNNYPLEGPAMAGLALPTQGQTDGTESQGEKPTQDKVLPKAGRIPGNPEELAEMEAAAQKGPGELYGWFYGPQCSLALKMAQKTWKELGVDDPSDQARRLLSVMLSHERKVSPR